MAGYEVVLRDGDREEIRLTDQLFEVGETVELDGRMWLVASAHPVGSQFYERRFVLIPAPADRHSVAADGREVLGFGVEGASA